MALQRSVHKGSKNLNIILGPTAVGKTTIGVKLAKLYNTEVLSADSRQFYKELKIGAAIPSMEEMQGVKHHFAGNLSIHDYYNVSMFENEAVEVLEKIFETHDHAVMVGGSGLYINAVCCGIDELPDADKKLRDQLKNTYKNKGLESLQQQLQMLDPEYYEMVDLSNPNRVLRAIEICLLTGKTYTSLRRKTGKKRNFRVIKIGLNMERDELFARINRRVDNMMEQGLLKEVRMLHKYKGENALNTVGYKELFDYIEEKISLEDAVTNIKTNTRRYAKRQLTWFKRDKKIQWFHPDNYEGIVSYIENSCNFV